MSAKLSLLADISSESFANLLPKMSFFEFEKTKKSLDTWVKLQGGLNIYSNWHALMAAFAARALRNGALSRKNRTFLLNFPHLYSVITLLKLCKKSGVVFEGYFDTVNF